MEKRLRLTRSAAVRVCLGTLMVLAPALTGGCPEFRDQLVDVAESATRSAILTGDSVETVAETAARSAVDASLTFLFDQLRNDTTLR